MSYSKAAILTELQCADTGRPKKGFEASLSFSYFVTGDEAKIVQAATERVSALLASSEPTPRTFGLTELDSLEEISMAPDAICIISLAKWLPTLETPWIEVEAEIGRVFDDMSKHNLKVVVLTIFRHVDFGEDFTMNQQRLVRIRRLNLIATELSRKFGVFVADIDRDLADIGGRVLGTDYRLGGAAALAAASHSLTACILINALDGIASIEHQDAALAAHLARKLNFSVVSEAIPTDVIRLGRGRRKQRVALITGEIQRDHASRLVKQVLSGQIGLRAALQKLTSAIRRRGLLKSADLLISALFALMKKQSG
jgi:hypothetical protein